MTPTRFALARPWLVLIMAAMLALAAVTQLFDPVTLTPRFDVDPSMNALLPQDSAANAIYARAQRYFDDDDSLLVALIGERPLGAAELAALERFTRHVERVPGVTGVDSLANAIAIEIGVDTTRIDPYLRQLPADDTAAAHLLARATADPLVGGRLLADDGSAALSVVHFAAGLGSVELLQRVDAIVAIAQNEAGLLDVVVSGPLRVRLEVGRILRADLYRVIPLAIGATLLVAALGFRSLRGVVLPVSSNLIATLLTCAAFIAAGHQPDFVTVMLAPVVYVIGFAYAVHMVTEFDRQLGSDGNHAAAARAVSEVSVPLAVTALTTSVAFAALCTSDIASIRVFGLFTALGVVLAWGSTLIVVPAGLVILPARRHAAPGAADALGRAMARRIMAWRRTIVCTGAVLGVLSLVAAARVQVDTAVLRNFSPDSAVHGQFERLAEHFAGPVPLRVMLTVENPHTFRQPDALSAVAALDAWLEAQPEIGGVYSLADYVAALFRAVAPDQARVSVLPQNERLAAHVLLAAGGDAVRRFADPSFSSTMLHVRSDALSTAAVNALGARITQRLATLPAGITGEVTGTTYLTARSVDAIARGQVASLGAACLAIFAVLALAFRSLTVGALALIPNALPVLFYFGLLGVIPIALSLTTSLVACAVFGIAIDDTVHFFTRFRREAARHGDTENALAATLAGVVRPVSLTTLAVGAGFLSLGVSELRSQAEFGLLAAATLSCAWALDVTFTPALCHLANRARRSATLAPDQRLAP